MKKCQDRDPDARNAREFDIPLIIELFKLNYPIFYPHPELYDEKWLMYAINSDDVILRVIDIEGVIACGSVFLDYGDYNHQVGLIGGMVAQPEGVSGGFSQGLKTAGSKIINDLACEAAENVACVISEARTRHRASQRYLEKAGLIPAGLLPHYNLVNESYESLVLYTDLDEEARKNRRETLPQVIAEVAPIAQRVLSAMELPAALNIVNDCQPYSDKFNGELLPEDQDSFEELRRIDCERSGHPVVFDSVSLDYGLPIIHGKNVRYRKAVNNRQPVGGIGYRFDMVSQLCKITDLAFNRTEVVNYLCAEAVSIAQQKGARMIEADLSAYDARIQQTFLSQGFHPVAYIPAMAVHNSKRLDIVKMIKLEIPYKPSEMRLSEKAREVVRLAERRLDSTHQ